MGPSFGVCPRDPLIRKILTGIRNVDDIAQHWQGWVLDQRFSDVTQITVKLYINTAHHRWLDLIGGVQFETRLVIVECFAHFGPFEMDRRKRDSDFSVPPHIYAKWVFTMVFLENDFQKKGRQFSSRNRSITTFSRARDGGIWVSGVASCV